MSELMPLDAYGALIEPTTLKIERLLPGPVERVWAFLTKGELRRKWLAAGEMELKVGAPFELMWRNDELPDRKNLMGVGAGWHAHLDLLVALAKGEMSPPFWDEMARLRQDYDRRLPA